MTNEITEGEAKKVITYDLGGKENGFLMELLKENDKTVVYLSAASAGAFKGYHLHKIRAARYICLRGTMKIILYVNGVREEHILTPGKKLTIPKNIPTGLMNISSEEAWLINFPDPPYDPAIKDEQVDFTQEQLDRGVVK